MVALEIIGVGCILAILVSGLYYLMVVRPDMKERRAKEAAERQMNQRDQQSQKGSKRR